MSAQATLGERPSGSTTGSILDRSLSAGFTLQDGYLLLQVEWFCGDNFEP